MDELWTPYIAAFALFVITELALYARRSYKFKDAKRVLRGAKREIEELVQLPLSNPHPLIQISDTGKVIFANPIALKEFPQIKDKEQNHPALVGVNELNLDSENKTATREIRIAQNIYHQTITLSMTGEQKSYIIYCYDITALKEVERQLKESQKTANDARKLAEKANQARGDFLANMSHELRTPMNGIIGLSDILVESEMPAVQMEMTEAINSSAHNLLILLNDILDFSKIEAGELKIESIPFDLRKIVLQIENLQKSVASQKGLTLSSQIADSIPTRLMGDPARLQQVLNNLTSNALKFTDSGSVAIKVAGNGDGTGKFITRISVTDTGIGIPENKQKKIFTKFQQADVSTARKYGGTGLGLAITKDLVELMGGHIGLESTEGKGTTFTVILPAKIAEETAADDDSKDTTKNAATGINTDAKVMVVDDHPVNLLFMRQTLLRLGFKDFDEALSGKEALALFEKRAYDLILLDCQMPEMDGFDAARAIRERETVESAPVIIAVTADAMKGAEEQCRQAGMDDYLSKPVDKKKLVALLQDWLPGDFESQEATDRPASTEPPSTNLVLDPAQLHEFTHGDKAVESEMAGIFIESLEEDLHELRHSFDEGNYEQWDSVVHKLYGAASHIGATNLARICDEAQSLFPDKNGHIKEIHPIILNEYAQLHQALLDMKK